MLMMLDHDVGVGWFARLPCRRMPLPCLIACLPAAEARCCLPMLLYRAAQGLVLSPVSVSLVTVISQLGM